MKKTVCCAAVIFLLLSGCGGTASPGEQPSPTGETSLLSMSFVIEPVHTNPGGIGYNMHSRTMQQMAERKDSNVKGKALTDWLLTAEGQEVVASAGYVGIFGALPPDEEEWP